MVLKELLFLLIVVSSVCRKNYFSMNLCYRLYQGNLAAFLVFLKFWTVRKDYCLKKYYTASKQMFRSWHWDIHNIPIDQLIKKFQSNLPWCCAITWKCSWKSFPYVVCRCVGALVVDIICVTNLIKYCSLFWEVSVE